MRDVWVFGGRRIRPAQAWRADGDRLPPLPKGVERRRETVWDAAAIRETVRADIASALDREAGRVVIARTATGVSFDGIGMPGRRIDADRTAFLAAEALASGITDVILPVGEIRPSVIVQDEGLRSRGVREVVAVGESDFTGSPFARRNNIAIGLHAFNGSIVPQGSVFSFNDILGPVHGGTGYLEELVILGDKTLPEFGGGLCQVSTTAYRGVWEYGFPIVERRNHSFAVRYYGPYGTDATIYPPHTDMRFVNDSPGDILIQTVYDPPLAFFLYYGTRDGRQSEIIGPYTWDFRSPPPDRIEYTADIPPGSERSVGERVPGLDAAWFRVVAKDGEERIESFYSAYEARPRYRQYGAVETEPRGDISERAAERAAERGTKRGSQTSSASSSRAPRQS